MHSSDTGTVIINLCLNITHIQASDFRHHAYVQLSTLTPEPATACICDIPYFRESSSHFMTFSLLMQCVHCYLESHKFVCSSEY